MFRRIGMVFALMLAAGAYQGAAAMSGLDAATRSIANGAPGVVEKVHGCHRFCTWGYVPKWDIGARHRHVGPFCQPRPCGRRFTNPPSGISGCFKIGPVWYCP